MELKELIEIYNILPQKTVLDTSLEITLAISRALAEYPDGGYILFVPQEEEGHSHIDNLI